MRHDIPLEDNYGDVLSKAQAGQSLADSDIGALAGLEPARVRAARRGEYVAEEASKLASALGLHAPALLALGAGNYRASAPAIEGLCFINVPCPTSGYPEMTVNATLVREPGGNGAWLFDTGANPNPVLALIRSRALVLKSIFFTHAHWDHVRGVGEFLTHFPGIPIFIHASECFEGATAIGHGHIAVLGGLKLKALHTPGHSQGGMTYCVSGLDQPVAIVGDAVFAGSVGGIRSAYHDTLLQLRDSIMTLPPETILCPGHGPMTTVAEQRLFNPFLGGQGILGK